MMSFDPANDPMGQAIHDYFHLKKVKKLVVKSDIAEDETIDISYFFRDHSSMPELEQTALKNCKGKVLDVGAGAGCHSIWLQQKKFSVTALELSPLASEVLKSRGIKQVQTSDFFHFNPGNSYDTLLLLMNGIGIVGTLENLPLFFEKCRQLLNHDGQILIESSDLIYLYGNNEEGYLFDLMGDYYGEVTYQIRYGQIKGNPFTWLFIDFQTLTDHANKAGFNCDLITSGTHYDYLAKITIW